MMFGVRVERWAAWHEGDAPPRVEFVTPIQRRRLSPLARIVLESVWQVVLPGEHLPSVFASRHGEVLSTHHMLTQLAAAEPLSPAEFSHSVHNSVVGQASIFRGDRSEATALSAGADTVASALTEAACLLVDAEAVLVAAYDEGLPAAYTPDMPHENERWALVMVLRRGEPNLFVRRGELREGALQGGVATSRAVRALLATEGHGEVRQRGERNDWVWSRHVA